MDNRRTIDLPFLGDLPGSDPPSPALLQAWALPLHLPAASRPGHSVQKMGGGESCFPLGPQLPHQTTLIKKRRVCQGDIFIRVPGDFKALRKSPR